MRGIALSTVAVLLLPGCSFRDDEKKSPLEQADLVVHFAAGPIEETDENAGTVGLTARGRRTVVTVEVAQPRASRQQAEIRLGDCATIGGAIVYMLNPLVEGKSETVVDAPLRVLKAGYMILVHHVRAEARIAGICADLSRARPPGATPVFE